MFHQPLRFAAVLLLLSGCATGPNPIDPYEDYNRQVFAFNEGVDQILTPTLSVYQSYFPPALRLGIYNFYSNLGEVSQIINYSLQGRFDNTRDSAMRLLVNSSFGCAGLFDMAHNLGLERKRTDFGETMYHYGYKESAFIMSPFFGPGTVRDSWGLLIDYTLFNPAFYLRNVSLRNEMLLINYLQKKASVSDYLKNFPEPAFVADRYIFIRDAFLQYRKYQLSPHSDNWENFYNQDELEETSDGY
jgi:phospholipid-binding lipoprotein MlaA